MENLLAQKILGKDLKKMFVVGQHFQAFFLFLMNGERGFRLELLMWEYMEKNSSAQNGSKTSCKRKPIRTYKERLHTEPFQSPM